MVKGNNGEENDGVEQCRISCEGVGLKDDQTWTYMVKLLFTNIQVLFVFCVGCIFHLFLAHTMLVKVPLTMCIFYIVISKTNKILNQREVNVKEDGTKKYTMHSLSFSSCVSRIYFYFILTDIFQIYM